MALVGLILLVTAVVVALFFVHRKGFTQAVGSTESEFADALLDRSPAAVNPTYEYASSGV